MDHAGLIDVHIFFDFGREAPPATIRQIAHRWLENFLEKGSHIKSIRIHTESWTTAEDCRAAAR